MMKRLWLFLLVIPAMLSTCSSFVLSNAHSTIHKIPKDRSGRQQPASLNSVNSSNGNSPPSPMPQHRGWLTRKRLVDFGKATLFAGAILAVATRAAVSPVQSGILARKLGLRNIAAATTMLFGLAVLPVWALGVPSLAKALAVAASRCALQVFLLGSVLLERLMGVDKPGLVAAWIFMVGLIAGREAFSRVPFTYPRMRQHVHASVLCGAFTVLSLTLGLKTLGAVEPWFQPRTWIPVAGMLFGNSLSVTALAASAITKNFLNLQDQMELRLSRGATWREAIGPVLQDTLFMALTPTINSLTATGIVHIPGMMTGQVLAGQSARQAAAYQIVLNFLIATTSFTTVQVLVRSAIDSLVDTTSHRLRQNMITPNKQKTGTTSTTNPLEYVRKLFTARSFGNGDSPMGSTDNTANAFPLATVRSLLSSSESNPTGGFQSSPVLVINELIVPRARTRVCLSVNAGDRIGIVGPSGVGKSQILRSIAGLEETLGGTMRLTNNATLSQEMIPYPEYRTKVVFVSQNRPTLQGTPRMFWDEIQQYGYQKHTDNDTSTFTSPMEIAKEWGITENLFDQPWSTLSGGEAQRISLAIALATKPKVLLLDESTSALDDATSQKVEKTLMMESNISIIMVTHSMEQLNRFCSHRMDMSPILSSSSISSTTSTTVGGNAE